jgi:DNA polymerase-3 subunit alpha
MADIPTLVSKAVAMGQPGIGLTDHGNMSGAFQVYGEAKRAGIKPFLGLEAYYVDSIDDKKAKRHHLSLLSYTTEGYQNLARLCSTSHQRDHYHYKPRIDRLDLVKAASSGGLAGIACLTGCFFSAVCQAIVAEPDEESGVQAAKPIVKFLQSVFPLVFIEVQHHHTTHDSWDDDRLVRALYKLAEETSSPTIITNDCHYCDKRDTEVHAMMKSVAYSTDISEAAFPGDSYHFATEAWVKNHYREHMDVWDASQGAYESLLKAHSLSIPVLDNYRYHVPKISDSPMATLRKLCERVLPSKAGYQERLDYELGVIEGLGFADYFLLVHDYVQWCARKGILVMARGSAAGSLTCFLLGFTQVDPLVWGLTFDRFLTPDRIRPPDIDLDIEDTSRAAVVDYLKNKYEVIQIGTYNRMGYDEETGRGSLFVQYMSAQRKILGDEFPAKLGRVANLHDLQRVRPEDAKKLKKLGDVPLRRSPGAHAAGFVVSAPPDHSIAEWLPTMLIPSSDTTVTQMMMDDVEDAGYIKIDLLGLRSLTTLRRCMELAEVSSLEDIPLDDKETFKFLRKGNADTGVFQLEGYTAAKGCREVKVKSVKDLILVNALYRPATRDHGYTAAFLENRADPANVRYPGAIFERHLAETFGVPVFQEQVLAILRDLGMPVDKLNDFLTAVKGKHAKGGYSDKSDALVAGAKADFERLCRSQGMTDDQVEDGWALVEGFAAYGFNRAHATAYALLGYQLAWFKVHHPVPFHASLLETTAGTPKEKKYVAEARRVGVPILAACVNRSGTLWTVDPSGKAIRRGLLSIKSVGPKAADAIVENQPFAGVEDLIERCPSKQVTGGKSWEAGELTGVLGALKKAGALKALGVGRG